MSRAAFGALLLSACAGTALDLEFFSDPAATLTKLDLDVKSNGTTLLSTSFGGDGGTLALPQSLRLLLDATSLDVHAKAYDVSGGTRERSAQLTLGGGTQKERIDLSMVSWCPATPVSAGETVLYDDTRSGTYLPFGYDPGHPLQDSTDACSGTASLQYTISHPIDGVGFVWPVAALARQVSFRVKASEVTPWLALVGDTHGDGGFFYLPTPEACRNDTSACDLHLGPEWQGFVFNVPAMVPPINQLEIANDFGDGHSVTLNFDDVRVVFAQ